jgi:NCAIR mutase (PurE)-related protein
LEIYLHKKFNVKANKSFYNGMNAGTPNFTVTKENHWAKNKTKEEVKEIYNKVSEKNKVNIIMQLEKDGHWTKNKHALD